MIYLGEHVLHWFQKFKFNAKKSTVTVKLFN